jgi:hypothetical protein
VVLVAAAAEAAPFSPARRQYSGVDVVDDNDDEDEEKKADEDAAPLASEPSPPFDPS